MNLTVLANEVAEILSPDSKTDPIEFIMDKFPLMMNEILALKSQVALLESQVLSQDDPVEPTSFYDT